MLPLIIGPAGVAEAGAHRVAHLTGIIPAAADAVDDVLARLKLILKARRSSRRLQTSSNQPTDWDHPPKERSRLYNRLRKE
jgi:hypothetical protein